MIVMATAGLIGSPSFADPLPFCLSVLPLCTQNCYVPTVPPILSCLKKAKDEMGDLVINCRTKEGVAGFCFSVLPV